ncbi:MAG: lysophospholipid acyltransferase family protein [Dysgonamonadaceae bacterium]|jgi:putative hemolysin|nr:lysophospholipid acyltransferase family protein [Dysgonamonadaceae bacterium]
MKEKLITIDDIKKAHPIFQKSYGDKLAYLALKLAGLDSVNRIYDCAKNEKGADIEDAMIDKGIGAIRAVHNIDVLRQFEGKPFITVSNHPYGHIDGIMLIGEVAKVRPDFRVMVNWMLGMIDIMEDHFIGVNPYSSGSLAERSSTAGVKECLLHLKENHPLGFFPAGAVSKNKINRIEDREWQPGVIKLIRKAKAPIVPVYISGKNSWLFNFLDLIDWRLRTVRLCHELNTKKGKTIHMVFGEPISVEEQQKIPDSEEFGAFLKKKTYELKQTLV